MNLHEIKGTPAKLGPGVRVQIPLDTEIWSRELRGAIGTITEANPRDLPGTFKIIFDPPLRFGLIDVPFTTVYPHEHDRVHIVE